MKRAILFVVVAAAVTLTAAPAQAAIRSVVITGYDTVGPPPDFVTTGPFTATGALCPSGQSVDLSRTPLPSATGTQNLLVTKRFTCDDGSGTFDVALFVHLTFSPFTDNYAWAITSGTGSYATARGFGSGSGQPQPDGTLLDTYTGWVVGS